LRIGLRRSNDFNEIALRHVYFFIKEGEMKRACYLLTALSLPANLLVAQTAPPAPTFEVASIRPHEGPLQNLGVYPNGVTLTATINPMGLILDAYHRMGYQVSLPAPGPATAVFYDVVAKAAGAVAPSRDEFRQMLQALLVDRFNLKFHHEMKEMAVYALVIGPKGPKLKPSAPDAAGMGRTIITGGRNYEWTMPKANMEQLVQAIMNSFLDRPVVDRTGLTGTYDLKLSYTPDVPANNKIEPGPNDISIFSAVQEQLGLKLEPQKAMVDVMVVDSLEKPSAN
jgi:uncharacterized protein (TIGR03435 family)